MFDWIRNWRVTEEERQQAEISAYVDGLMSPTEQAQFEETMVVNSTLHQSVRQQQAIKQALRQLPAIPAPRNFTLTSEMVSQTQPTASWFRKPMLQTGLALAAFILIAGITFITLQSSPSQETVAQVENMPQGSAGDSANGATSAESPTLAEATIEIPANDMAAEDAIFEESDIVADSAADGADSVDLADAPLNGESESREDVGGMDDNSQNYALPTTESSGEAEAEAFADLASADEVPPLSTTQLVPETNISPTSAPVTDATKSSAPTVELVSPRTTETTESRVVIAPTVAQPTPLVPAENAPPVTDSPSSVPVWLKLGIAGILLLIAITLLLWVSRRTQYK